MEEQLISFETAKLVKEKGVNIKYCKSYYTIGENGFPEGTLNHVSVGIPAPTQSLLQKWLREVHGIDIILSRIPPEAVKAGRESGNDKINNYVFYLWIKNANPRIPTKIENSYHERYEEALERGLQEALKQIK